PGRYGSDFQFFNVKPGTHQHFPATIPAFIPTKNVVGGNFDVIERDVGGGGALHAETVDSRYMHPRGVTRNQHDGQVLVSPGIFAASHQGVDVVTNFGTRTEALRAIDDHLVTFTACTRLNTGKVSTYVRFRPAICEQK